MYNFSSKDGNSSHHLKIDGFSCQKIYKKTAVKSLCIAFVIMATLVCATYLNVKRISAQMPAESETEEQLQLSYSEDRQKLIIKKNGDGIYAAKFVKDETSQAQTHAFSGQESVIPFTMGDGVYHVSLFKKINGEYIYLETYRCDGLQFDFLSLDLYCDYTSASFSGAPEQIAAKIRESYRYGYLKSLSVNEAYHPRLDEIRIGDGLICSDYAALFAAACRSQGIPCKICIGYVNNSAHAWNEYYLDGQWHFIDLLNLSEPENYRTKIEA